MNTVIKTFLAGAVIALAPALSAAQDVLRLATLQTGTVNWELDTIKHYGLDAKHGFTLEVQGLAGNPATRIAFQGGEADAMVADWLWVARQRAEGQDFVFIPYSTAVGGVLVKDDSGIDSLDDLSGQKIGIAGGPVDKSWLIVRAYAAQQSGLDLAAETEQVFGAPPLIMQAGISGEVSGVINFWHFMAKMKTKGFRELITVAEASEALGLDPATPLLGYVVKGEMVRDNPDLIKGLAAASAEAKAILATDDAAWDRLREKMRVANDAEFEALKAGFRAGIPGEGAVDEAAAAKMFDLMVELGGEKLMGSATSFPEGVFYQGD